MSNLLRKVASSQSLSKPITTNYIIFNPPAGHKGNESSSLRSIKYSDQNVDIPTGPLAVGGTSAPSNATHTNCNVAVQINQHGFVQASPHDSKITIGEPGIMGNGLSYAIKLTNTSKGKCCCSSQWYLEP